MKPFRLVLLVKMTVNDQYRPCFLHTPNDAMQCNDKNGTIASLGCKIADGQIVIHANASIVFAHTDFDYNANLHIVLLTRTLSFSPHCVSKCRMFMCVKCRCTNLLYIDCFNSLVLGITEKRNDFYCCMQQQQQQQLLTCFLIRIRLIPAFFKWLPTIVDKANIQNCIALVCTCNLHSNQLWHNSK